MVQSASIRELLSVGRSATALGRVDEVIALICAHPRRISQLIECLYADDPGTANRAADAVEKLTRVDSPLDAHVLEKWKSELIELMAEARFNKLKWNLALILPRLTLTRSECSTIAEILRANYLDDRSSIVKTFALHSLADLTRQNPVLLPEVLDLLRIHGRSGTAAMRARSRILLKLLEKPELPIPMPGMSRTVNKRQAAEK